MNIQEIHKKQHEFFTTQKSKDVNFRKDSLKAFQKVLRTEEDSIMKALFEDLGKAEFEAYLTEYFVVMGELKTMLKNMEKWSQPRRVKSSALNFPSKDYLLPEPFGVCLQISPWNYPFQLSLATLIGAVAAGNTVVLKPSEHAPKTATLLAQLIEKAFDPQHVTVVNGDASAPIQLTAKRIVWGKYVNCGQTCIAPDYLLVEETIKAPLLKALVEEIKNAYGEDASTSHSYGRIAHQRHFDRLVDLVKGSDLIYGGDNDSKTRYFGPTVLEVSDTQHPTMAEEIFGPILPVLTYSEEKELDPIISSFERPLGFYVFSKRKNFIQDIFHRYSYGGGVANDTMIQFANDKLPFGGVGHSGLGAYHGQHSFDAFTHFKPFIKRGTWIDPFVRYAPYPTSFGWLKKLLKSI